MSIPASNSFFRPALRLRHGVSPIYFFVLMSLLILSLISKAWAETPYTLAQIQAERTELQVLSDKGSALAVEAIDERIALIKNDPVRVAALYLHSAFLQMHKGLPIIEKNLAKALSIIDDKQQPELYLYAMTINAYGLSMFQDNTKGALDLLEKVQDHPALKNDLFVHVVSLVLLLDSYYRLDLPEKVSRPLYQLVKLVKSKENASTSPDYQMLVNEELANHLASIGDVKQAEVIYKELINKAQLENVPEYTAILYCHLANMEFLPLTEKFQYARASLANKGDISCSDMMHKLVLLEEVWQGNLDNIEQLGEFSSLQQFPTSNEFSAYYAGLAYLHLNDLTSTQKMLDRITSPDAWLRYDLLQQLAAKKGEYKTAFFANQKYYALLAKKNEEARNLMVSSYQVRLELAQEETKAIECVFRFVRTAVPVSSGHLNFSS